MSRQAASERLSLEDMKARSHMMAENPGLRKSLGAVAHVVDKKTKSVKSQHVPASMSVLPENTFGSLQSMVDVNGLVDELAVITVGLEQLRERSESAEKGDATTPALDADSKDRLAKLLLGFLKSSPHPDVVAGACRAIAAFQLRELHVVEAIHAALRKADSTAVQAAASKALNSLGQVL